LIKNFKQLIDLLLRRGWINASSEERILQIQFEGSSQMLQFQVSRQQRAATDNECPVTNLPTHSWCDEDAVAALSQK